MTTEAVIEYGDHRFTLATHDDCSVSAYLRRSRQFYELSFLQILAATIPPDLVAIDVGAHIGNHTLFFATMMDMRVLSVEPNPQSFDLLRRNIDVNIAGGRVKPVQVALSDRRGRVSMAAAVGTDAGTVAIQSGGTAASSFEADAVTLDELWSSNPLDLTDEVRVGLLKVDGEGHELQVLAGGLKLLREYRPVVTTKVQSVEEFQELHALLGDEGYRPAGVFNPTPTVVWAAKSGVCGAIGRSDRLSIAAMEHTIRLTEELNCVWSQLPRPAAGGIDTRDGRPDHVLVLGSLPAARSSFGDATVTTIPLCQSGIGDSNGMPNAAARSRTDVTVQTLDAIDQFGLPDLVLADHDPATHSVVDHLARGLGAPYVLVYRHDVPANWQSWELMNGAVDRLLSGPSPMDWQQRLIFSARPLDVGEIETEVARLARRRDQNDAVVQQAADVQVRVALVSYFAPPCQSVGVNRVDYWHRAVPEVARRRDLRVSVELLTASGSGDDAPGYRRILDGGLSNPLAKHREVLIERLASAGLDTIAAAWTPYLLQAFGEVEPYDVVVMSGNPFYFFDAALRLRELGSKVILDFRDPFARHPRMKRSAPQKRLLKELEDGYLAGADAVTSVNETCLELICGEGFDGRCAVVSNGYDERYLAESESDRHCQSSRGSVVVLAGRLYRTHDPTYILQGLSHGSHRLIHIGPPDGRWSDVHPGLVESRGLVPYHAVGNILSEADLGLIITNGDPFEHTTKVFDYIGADLEILIVTDGEPHTGELELLTAGLEGVYWCRNEAREINEFFSRYVPAAVRRPRRAQFSRSAQTDRLLDLILELSGGRSDDKP